MSLAWERSKRQIPSTVFRECIPLLHHCKVKKIVKWNDHKLGTIFTIHYAQNDSILWDSHGKEFACNAEDPSSLSGSGRSLEKKLATHSSILAWRIPWTEEPGGLQSMGSQKVGHD